MVVVEVLLPLELRSRKRPRMSGKRGFGHKGKVDVDEKLRLWEQKDNAESGEQSKTQAGADSDGGADDDDADDYGFDDGDFGF